MSKRVTNTSAEVSNPEGAFDFIAEAMVKGSAGNAILGMEARGQHELVNSTQLPTKGSDDPEILAMGIVFGEATTGDSLFRSAVLPKGWKKVASDHSMWSYIVDADGNRRIAVFYKAAFYDRSAYMRAEHQ